MMCDPVSVVLLVLLGYLAISLPCCVAYCAMSWFFGTGPDNRPALRAAQAADLAARRAFVDLNMSRVAA